MKTVIKILLIVSISLPMSLSAQWNDNGSTLTTNDNVGIRTTTPTQALDVNGNIKLPDATNGTLGSVYYGGITNYGQIGMRLFGGNVANSYPGGFIDVVSNNANEGLRFRIDQNNGSAERMRITAGGRVGIGVTTPAQRLHVKGRVRASNTNISEYVEIYHGGSHGFINTSGDGNLDFRHDNVTGMSLTDTGNLGIGTTTPTQKLEVNGNIKLPDATGSEGSVYYGGITDDGEIGMRLFGGNVSDGDYPGGFIDIVTNSSSEGLRFRIDQNNGSAERMRIRADGKVVIGNNPQGINTPGDYKLYVDNGILTEKVKVATVNSADWADYVFESDYDLNSTEEVEAFIKTNKHLPNVPSAKAVSENGIDMVEMDATLLRQIEELWLHVIELKKENDVLKEEVKTLKKQ